MPAPPCAPQEGGYPPRIIGKLQSHGCIGKTRVIHAIQTITYKQRKCSPPRTRVPDSRQAGSFGQSDRLSVHQVLQNAPHRVGMSAPGNVLGLLLACRACVLVVGHRSGPVGLALRDLVPVGCFDQRAFQTAGTALSNRMFLSAISGYGRSTLFAAVQHQP
jgi:hypothetical protein